MMDVSIFIQNPMLIIGGFFVVGALVYFFFEIFNFNQKTTDQKEFVLLGWGILLIAISALVMLSPVATYVFNSFSGNNELHSINYLQKRCLSDNLEYIFYQDVQQSCQIIDLAVYCCYGLFGFGVLFIFIGILLKIVDSNKINRKIK